MAGDGGVVAAALTPRDRRGELNFSACFDLLDHLSKARVRAIALLTQAGEYPLFTLEQRNRLVYLGAKRSRVPLLAGVGSEELAASIDLAQEALGAGAEGVILPPPTLFVYPQQELREYYLRFALEVGDPGRIWIANPGALSRETLDDLLSTGSFAGITGEDLHVSSEACAVPELFVALDCARRRVDRAQVDALEACAAEFQHWVDRFAPLVAVKLATEVRGIATGSLPIPVGRGRAHLVNEFRTWFSAWLPGMRKLAADA